jgi:hypothetical protein
MNKEHPEISKILNEFNRNKNFINIENKPKEVNYEFNNVLLI